MSLALKLALSPLLLAQAVLTRARLPRLPEAAGDREGIAGTGEAAPPLWIVGDSSAAGVGAATQEEALAGSLSHELAERSGRAVSWRLLARSGVNTAQAMELLHDLPGRQLPTAEAPWPGVAVLVTGVNDVVDQVPPRQAIAAREALVRALAERAGVGHVVVTPVPPMHRFAGLPQPLRWVAGRDASAHERALQRWAASTNEVSHLPFDLPVDDADLLAVDGFHPGPRLYRLWGQALAAHLIESVWPAFGLPRRGAEAIRQV